MVNQKKNKTEPIIEKAMSKPKYPVLSIVIKTIVLLLLVALALFIVDEKGIFEADNTNNHTKKKWDAFYDFTKHNEVDVVLIGNSHLYTGINPKNLSSKLGVNAFILASPGTSTADYYYSLEEALQKCTPKVVVIETYGINGAQPHDFTASALADQIKSFSAREDKLLKIKSTPDLFSLKNYAYAWSTPIRNHDFLYKNPEQIEKNTEEKSKRSSTDELYLGRYVRFQTGISDSILHLYDSLGAPVNGNDVVVNDLDKKFMSKIQNTCAEKGIKLVVLTLPMYTKHVKNYPQWKKTVGSAFDSSLMWLDMQDSIDYIGFDTRCFENTYSQNQHMSYAGSLLATYKLADYLLTIEDLELPNRKTDYDWRKLFYGAEGFFENNRPAENDTTNIIVFETVNDNASIEILQIKEKESDKIIVKISTQDSVSEAKMKTATLRLNTQVILDGKILNANIDLLADVFHSSKGNLVFIQNVQKLKISKFFNAQFIY